MSEEHTLLSMPAVPLILGALAVICGCLLVGVAGYFVLFAPDAIPGRAGPTATVMITRTLIFPTVTLAPTEAPTNTPAPTATTPPPAQPTDAPAPTTAPTNPPAPTSPPQPTATSSTEPTATTASSGRLINVAFSVDNPVVNAGAHINFRFSVTNGGTQHIVFGPLGVAVFDSNGVNKPELFHTSWMQWDLDPNEKQDWSDSMVINVAGSYQLQLSVCYDCHLGGNDWEYLGPRVTVTVN